jgi:hypothetical protein
MNKQKTGAGNKQSDQGSMTTAEPVKKATSGKDAASHTKAGSDKGAGGGKKRARKH